MKRVASALLFAGMGLISNLSAKCLKGDCFTGIGVEQTNSFIYAGNYERGVFDGHGALLAAGGISYRGDFMNGVFHGQGIFVDQLNRIGYEGNWARGRFDGYGELRDFDNSKYYGDWVGGVFHGRGIYASGHGSCPTLGQASLKSIEPDLIISGCKYEGDWAHNLPNGRGQLTLYMTKPGSDLVEDNLIFSGNWLEGKPRRGQWTNRSERIHTENNLDFRWQNPAIERWANEKG